MVVLLLILVSVLVSVLVVVLVLVSVLVLRIDFVVVLVITCFVDGWCVASMFWYVLPSLGLAGGYGGGVPLRGVPPPRAALISTAVLIRYLLF